jgi:transaldolase
MELGIISGITTNQKIFLQDKQTNIKKTIHNLIQISNKMPVNIELTKTSETDSELLSEAAEYSDVSKHIVIKIPMWGDGRGLRIAKKLKSIGIQTNITCCMSTEQVIMASLVGADYVSLFFNRIIDYYFTKPEYKASAYELACDTISASVRYLTENGIETQLIVGSIREPSDVTVALLKGADIVTVPPNILAKMFYHPKTEETIKEFDECWKKLNYI